MTYLKIQSYKEAELGENQVLIPTALLLAFPQCAY